jgi:hypothetical protein
VTPIFYKNLPEFSIPPDPIREFSIVGDGPNLNCTFISQPKVVTEIVDQLALARKKHQEAESISTLEKLSKIIIEFPQSILENRDVLAQILQKLDDETRALVLMCP